MILVCQKHVHDGIKMLKVPHIRKASFESPCRFCNQEARFEIYYFKYLAMA
ncbi:hypothetical protein ACFFHM_12370 [Halalkalibacter kiskunsagensis]|uniref:Uncharacterized protein n=1 Tax=Halalkalibacter kiskunsagensis TaxID=1548599 RepID=A0ABV6KD68_9BACI